MRGRWLALMALLLVAGGAGAWLLRGRGPSTPSAGPTAPSGRTPEARVARLENSLRAVEDGVRDAPRDRWDPAYVVAMVGRNADSLQGWVRDNTAWIPYRGILRGPTGVLMDRQGNSLDRAVLLAALLASAGHEARLARTDLGAQRAVELLPDLVARRANLLLAEPVSGGSAAISVDEFADRYELDGADIERVLGGYEAGTGRLLDDLAQRVPVQTSRLLSSIAAPDGDAEWGARRDSALAALRDHWWAQVRTGEGWADLDLLDSNAPGGALVPLETVSPTELAPALNHEIAIRVIAERLAGGKLIEERTLEHTIRPSELIGQPIVLQFWPDMWPNRAPVAEDMARTTRQLASGQESWSAALVVGNEVVAGGTLAGSGAAPTRAPGFGGLGGAMAEGLGGRRGTASAEHDSLLTAVWIEYSVAVPGRRPRVIRRAAFDLIGQAARDSWIPGTAVALTDELRLTRGLSLMMRTEVLPVVSRLASDFVLHLHGRSLLANADLLRAVSRESFGSDQHVADSLLRLAEPAVSPLYALAVLRHDALAQAAYIDRPAILTRHQYPRAIGDRIALEDATDIVTNEAGIALTESDAFVARLAQGVWDTNLEALLAGSRAAANTALAYAEAGDWTTIPPTTRDHLATGLTADAAALMRRDLASGYAVVAPGAPISLDGEAFSGWWRVDPETGDALGIGATGWGQSAPGYGLHIAAFVEMAKPFVFAYALCQYIPQAANSLNILGSEFWRLGISPSWTTRPEEGKDFEDVAVENHRMCVIEAILAGFVATAPLLRGMFAREAEVSAELRLGRARPGTMPSIPRPPGTSPRPRGYPAPQAPAASGRGPGGTLPGGATPSADPFGKTQPGVRPTRPGPPPIRTRPGPPPTPAPAQRPAPPQPLSPAEARAKVQETIAARNEASKASFEATRDYVQYRNNMPNPARGHAGNPANWDPKTGAELEKRMWEKQGEAIERINDWKTADRALRDAQAAAARAQGRSGLAQVNRAPPPAPAPKPVGNENPTVPQQAVPGAPSGGALEAGSAGISSSLSPGSDP